MNKDDIGNFLVINPKFLVPVTLVPLNKKLFNRVAGSMMVKGCYNNALNAAIDLDARAIVIGVAVINDLGFPVEHAWIQMPDGSHTDPTFQDQHGEEYVDKYTYYSLYTIPRSKYLRLAKELSPGSQVMAIDMTTLRRWPETQHLFNNPFMRNLYDRALAKQSEKKAQEDS